MIYASPLARVARSAAAFGTPLGNASPRGRGAAALLLTLALTACATPEPKIVVREVKVPVSVPCKVTLPERGPYAADSVSLDGSIFDLVQSLLVEREQRKQREILLEAAAKSCS